MAVDMLEKLLVPVHNDRNEHKRDQLRELAALKGRLRNDDVVCWVCGDGRHPTIDCPMKGSIQGAKMDDEYRDFLTEHGGGGPEGSMEKSNSDFQRSALPSNSPWAGGAGGVGNTGSGIRGADSSGSGGSGSSQHGLHRPGLGFNPENKLNEEIDDTNLYVAYLPHTVDDGRLIQLFSPFGRVEKIKIMMDRMNGTSKGYGFVKYFDAGCAAQAVTHMNGYKLEGKTLAVSVAGRAPLPPGSGLRPEGSMEKSNSDFQRLARPSNSPWAGGAGGVGNTGSGIRGADSSGSGGSGSSQHGQHRPGLGFNPENKLNEEIDDTNLYVAYLPQTVDDDRLIQLFSPFGRVEKSKIMMDRMKGTSKGYGFVNYFDACCATQAVTHMNGYKLEGKTLVVRVAGRAPLPPGSGLGPARGAYVQQQPQPPVPMTPSSYGPPPWVSQSSYGHFSNNHTFRMPNPSEGPVQTDPYSAPPPHYVSCSPYQMPLPSMQMHGNMQIQARAQQVQIMQGSSIAQQIPGIQDQPGTRCVSGMSGSPASQQVPAMQTPPGAELVSGNELSSHLPWSDAPPLGGMPQFSENKPSMSSYQPYYAPPPIAQQIPGIQGQPGTQYVSGMLGPSASQQVPAMQTPPGAELVSGNELSSHPRWAYAPPPGGMPQFLENKPSMPPHQPYYAPPPFPPSNMASSLPPPHTSVPSLGGGTPQWASFPRKQENKAVDTKYENFLSEMSWRHQHKIST